MSFWPYLVFGLGVIFGASSALLVTGWLQERRQ